MTEENGPDAVVANAEPGHEATGRQYSMPERYRDALYLSVEDAMPPEFVGEVAEWLHAHREWFTRGGDAQGVDRFNYELPSVEKYWEGVGKLRARLLELLPGAIEANKIPDFDLEFIETHATLYHHGGHFCWHDDAPGYDGVFVETRRLAYCYYLHSTPKMFSGGELEFLDGTRIEPKANSIVFFHPLQQHQIRRVECWSKDFLHGRWALFGWIHGQPPPGYSAPKLRGIPRSG